MATAKPLLPLVPPPLPGRRSSSASSTVHSGHGSITHHGKLATVRERRRMSSLVARVSLLRASLFLLDDSAAADVAYTSASYCTSLGRFVVSSPGVWSLIKRSIKSKVAKFAHRQP